MRSVRVQGRRHALHGCSRRAAPSDTRHVRHGSNANFLRAGRCPCAIAATPCRAGSVFAQRRATMPVGRTEIVMAVTAPTGVTCRAGHECVPLTIALPRCSWLTEPRPLVRARDPVIGPLAGALLRDRTRAKEVGCYRYLTKPRWSGRRRRQPVAAHLRSRPGPSGAPARSPSPRAPGSSVEGSSTALRRSTTTTEPSLRLATGHAATATTCRNRVLPRRVAPRS